MHVCVNKRRMHVMNIAHASEANQQLTQKIKYLHFESKNGRKNIIVVFVFSVSDCYPNANFSADECKNSFEMWINICTCW